VFKAGLLALGSSYFPHLPIPLKPNSGIVQISSPITAAGPLPVFTGFPIKPNRHLEWHLKRSEPLCQVRKTNLVSRQDAKNAKKCLYRLKRGPLQIQTDFPCRSLRLWERQVLRESFLQLKANGHPDPHFDGLVLHFSRVEQPGLDGIRCRFIQYRMSAGLEDTKITDPAFTADQDLQDDGSFKASSARDPRIVGRGVLAIDWNRLFQTFLGFQGGQFPFGVFSFKGG
jgi:hypothetical protein